MENLTIAATPQQVKEPGKQHGGGEQDAYLKSGPSLVLIPIQIAPNHQKFTKQRIADEIEERFGDLDGTKPCICKSPNREGLLNNKIQVFGKGNYEGGSRKRRVPVEWTG